MKRKSIKTFLKHKALIIKEKGGVKSEKDNTNRGF